MLIDIEVDFGYVMVLVSNNIISMKNRGVLSEILILCNNVIIKKTTAQREGNSHEKTQCKTRNPEHRPHHHL